MMNRKLIVEFTKMSGAGNDFIVIDNRFFFFNDEELSQLARTLCVRRLGIGADGLLVFNEPDNPEHHYRMKYFNADGSLGTMCGNGARCLARFAVRVGIPQGELVFESDAGIYRALSHLDEDLPVKLYVQPPEHYVSSLDLDVDTNGLQVSGIWTGTEHVVLVVEHVEEAPVNNLGPVIRNDETLAPAGANVNFVQVLHNGRDANAALRVRTYEKGVEAETLACGTGAMASVITAYKRGLIYTPEATVQMPGGTLAVGFDENKEEGSIVNLYLEGPAVTVYRGSFEWEADT